ncbi:hypothetical protein, partial [Klebsiella quasipneumoniae]|uniref:hypothetical protein n=1 Tax=Klebsiella quasipneumoniae TaxID=1463165 RepID=UPI001A923588
PADTLSIATSRPDVHFISTIIEFLNSHKKTLRWVRLPLGLNALQLCDEYFSTNNRHLKCM